jgi:predicted RNase H-like HicB family nuclease
MDQFYPIIIVTIDAADGGGFMGFAPDLRGCMSDGATPEEALQSTHEAVLEWLEEAKASNREIPLPGTASDKAKKERRELIEIIKDQEKAIGKLSKDLEAATHVIDGLKEQFRGVMERADELATPWAGFAIANASQQTEDSVH